MPHPRRRCRFGIRLQLAVGWWRIRLRFPPRRYGSWRLWFWLALLGTPLGYVLSLPVVVYLFERFDLDGGMLEKVLEIYYLPLIYLLEYWPWFGEALEWCLELLQFLFGDA